MYGKGSLKFHRSTDLFVRRLNRNEVLRVECTERCCDGWPYPDDSLFHAGPKHGDPKIATKKQLGTAHGRRAAGMVRAIMFHFLGRRCGMIHDASRMGGLTICVHLPLQRLSMRGRM
jgi:hypothetical protein